MALEAIRDAGIINVGIVVGDTASAIRSAVGGGRSFGLNVTYIGQEAPLGLAYAVLVARDFLGDDDFVMYLGDNFIVGGISRNWSRSSGSCGPMPSSYLRQCTTQHHVLKG